MIISSSHYIAHTDPRFSMTKGLKLEDLYKYQVGIFMHKGLFTIIDREYAF